MKIKCDHCGANHEITVHIKSPTASIGIVIFGMTCDKCQSPMFIANNYLVQIKKKEEKKVDKIDWGYIG